MVSKTISIKISEAYVEEGKTVINGIKLRKFQEDLLDSLGKYDKILLRAPTGSGKTFTLILAAIKSYLDHDYYPVVGIYPSKALVYDQARSIYETLSRMNLSREGNKFTGRLFINNEEKGEITLNVYILTGEKKEIPKEFKFSPISIVLTVPEYPYMFMTAMNRQNVAAQVIEAATKYSFDEAVNELSVRRNEIRELLSYFSVFFNGYWFIDEFHLYSGIARSSMLILVEMFEKYNSVIKSNKSIVFSSATPVPIRVSKVIDVGVSKEGSKIRKATLVNFHLSSVNPQEELVNYIQRNESEIRGRKVAVIIDRVYYVAELCNKVKYAAVVWGLNKEFGNCKNVKENLDKEDFIIGNHAMSFGIDLNLDKGFIHAHDAETLIQRLGRFGRRGEGEAEVHIFTDSLHNVVRELDGLNGKTMDYDEFLRLIERIYKKRIDDKLDKIFFSELRHYIMIRTFSLIYAISQGEQAYSLVRQWYPQVTRQLKVRPSYDDYFYVFAYRPGGLKGKWCDGDGEDDLFSLIRNFKYVNGCFTKEPLKETPGIIPRESKLVNVKCGFMQFSEFNDKLSPRLLLKNQRYSILMGNMKEFRESYVIILTRDCVDWENFSEMAKLISTYESAIPIYKNEDMTTVIGLAIFI